MSFISTTVGKFVTKIYYNRGIFKFKVSEQALNEKTVCVPLNGTHRSDFFYA